MRKSIAKIEFARHLRKTSQASERLLWQLLRNRKRFNAKFRREHPFGPYIADFICLEHNLVIEIDGIPHFTPEHRAYDQARDIWMIEQGFRVLRFTGKQVEFETDIVLERIREEIRKTPHPPTPSPRVQGEGETHNP